VRIYTKTGDQGETGLVGGERVSKDALRVEAYGSVDELNAALGAAIAVLDRQRDDDLLTLFSQVQGDLFDVGADLATRERAGSSPTAPRTKSEHITYLESAIDRLNAALTPLRAFILPGGSRGGASFHVARTVCRRAERAVVRLNRVEPVASDVLAYLNRLSDLLFVAARTVNAREGHPETQWQPPAASRETP
jgi:cob(I)alamin adenosyltransferase